MLFLFFIALKLMRSNTEALQKFSIREMQWPVLGVVYSCEGYGVMFGTKPKGIFHPNCSYPSSVWWVISFWSWKVTLDFIDEMLVLVWYGYFTNRHCHCEDSDEEALSEPFTHMYLIISTNAWRKQKQESSAVCISVVSIQFLASMPKPNNYASRGFSVGFSFLGMGV